jgi:hypothetical protein
VSRSGWIVATAVAVGLTGACSDSGGGATVGPQTVVTQTATTGVVTTPTTVATTTSVTIPQTPQPTPAAAADGLLNAWRAGNGLAALTVADKAAVDVVFAIPPEAGQSRGCNSSGADPSYCVYRLSAGELQLRVSKRGDGWIVSGAILGS